MLTYQQKMQELKNILKIAPNNKAVEFIYWRFLQDDYRGIHLLQHNRWTFKKFKAIIFAIVYSQDENGYIKVPRGDEIKNFLIGDYPQYGNLVNLFSNKYKEITGNKKKEGTPNTVKKNLFPDLARMNVIDRYRKTKNGIVLLNPNKKGSVDLIRMRSYLELDKKNIEDEFFLSNLYNQVSKNIYTSLPTLIFDLITDEELEGKISQDEFLFFITWYNKEYLKNDLKFNDIKDLILEWRKLNLAARKHVVTFIKNWAIPNHFVGVKKNKKRDYNNFKNETQEIMQHIKNSQIFALDENAKEFQIVFKIKDEKIIRYRSNTPKLEYFKNHNVKKRKGFEFDHVVPISWSTTWDEAIKICSWKNLIYIDAKKHAIKTQSNNIYVFLDKRDEVSYIYLNSSNEEDFLSLKLHEEILFNMNLFDDIKNYNADLNNYISKQ